MLPKHTIPTGFATVWRVFTEGKADRDSSAHYLLGPMRLCVVSHGTRSALVCFP